MRWQPGVRLGPRRRSLQSSPNPLAGFWGGDGKGQEREGKGKGRGGKGKGRGGREEGKGLEGKWGKEKGREWEQKEGKLRSTCTKCYANDLATCKLSVSNTFLIRRVLKLKILFILFLWFTSSLS